MTTHYLPTVKHFRTTNYAVRTLRRSYILVIAAALSLLAPFAQTAHASPPAQWSADEIPHGVFLPQLSDGDAPAPAPAACPAASDAVFQTIPIEGPPTDRPAALHADLNLSLRSYSSVSLWRSLVDIDGPTDADPPQLAGVSQAAANLNFVGTYRVNKWDWFCGEENGCPGEPIVFPRVTLLGVAGRPGTPIRVPSRQTEIYNGGYVAVVLYAEQRRITLAYTRHDTVATGYVVHIEDFCVDPVLLALYRYMNSAGRGRLPALRSLEHIGTGIATPLKVAVRDTGSFMDPRSRKDWWMEY